MFPYRMNIVNVIQKLGNWEKLNTYTQLVLSFYPFCENDRKKNL